jgi:hypothetical protein
MKRLFTLLIAATALSLAFASLANAQQVQGGIVIQQHRISQGPEGAPPPPPDGNFVFVASESFGGKVIKGAPYSADAVTETIQTLADGNRIINRMTSSVFRDSEGRTRREQSFKGLGILGNGNGEEPVQTIFINDPVAGVTYTLDSRSRTAHKSVPFTLEWTKKLGAPGEGSVEGHQQFEFKIDRGAGTPPSNITMAVPLDSGSRVVGPEIDQFTMRTEPGAPATYVFKTAPGANANEVKEQLGKQLIEGVEAEGTRTKVTIPAGEIGNERPIEIISERWYSPELQLVVMTRQSDPRIGETTYKLTNINRVEPAKTLFEVPAGYTVKEGRQLGPPVGPLIKTRKLANPEE